MTIVHRITINVPRERVFALYADVGSWPMWDSETIEVGLSALRSGATGWLKPRQGPTAKIRVTDVVPDRSFTVEARLPLCRMQFGHELDGTESQTVASHWVRFEGPLAFLFRRLIGSGIDRTLPNTLAGLKRAAETAGLQQ